MATIGGGLPILTNGVSSNIVGYLVACAVLTFFSTIAVALRFLSRRMKSEYGMDDWLCLAALLSIHAFVLLIFLYGTIGHAGYHMARFTPEQLEVNLKINFVGIIFYCLAETFARLSVLAFYRRIFPVRSMKICVWIFNTVSIVSLVAGMFAIVFATHPVEAQWKPWLPSTSINRMAMLQALSIISLLLDIIILAIPQKQIWKLQLSFKRRLSISLLLLVGLFTSITSGIRIAYLAKLDMSDITYSITDSGIWSVIELSLSVICACAPTFPALTKRWHKHGTARVLRNQSSTSGFSGRSPLRTHEESFKSQDFDSDPETQVTVEKPANVVHVQHDVEIREVDRDGSTDVIRSSQLFRP